MDFAADLRDSLGGRVIGGVTWSVSNPRVASISPNGVLTTLDAGSLTVTATASGGKKGSAFVRVLFRSDTAYFSLIPAGTFQMGKNDGDMQERYVHSVTLTKAFYMQRTEVTKGLWRAVMGTYEGGTDTAWCAYEPLDDPSTWDSCPVDQVRWNAAQEFIKRLNTLQPGMNYRLPTEAEWEYAARATTTGDFGGTGNLDEMGWYSGNTVIGETNFGPSPHAVAQKEPNAWGLFDMHGNVFELVQDYFSFTCGANDQCWGYPEASAVDPQGPATGTACERDDPDPCRVVRGGSVSLGAEHARSSFRGGIAPAGDHLPTGFGFRLARTP
jgi:formylglycine-generating enzyme required for sulfatase activity